MPNATKYFGTFHISPMTFTFGKKSPISSAHGKTAPHAANPKVDTSTPAVDRLKSSQYSSAFSRKISDRIG